MQMQKLNTPGNLAGYLKATCYSGWYAFTRLFDYFH
jgi:hypothetical protein